MVKGHGIWCNCCKPKEEKDAAHLATPNHKFNELLMRWREDRKALFKDRHNVELKTLQGGNALSYNKNKGQYFFKITPREFLLQGKVINFKCTITNKRKDPIHITYANVLIEHIWSASSLPGIIELKQNKSYTAIVKFLMDDILVGSWKIPICFSIKIFGEQNHVFHIIREINIEVAEKLTIDIEDNESPFKGNPWIGNIDIKPCLRKPFDDQYPLPLDYKKPLLNGLDEDLTHSIEEKHICIQLKNQLIPGYVTANNYKDFWSIVLWLEEVKQESGLEFYNMENVKLLLKEDDELELEVPGLVDKRPSLIVGDKVDIRMHNDPFGYRGVIASIYKNTVRIKDVDTEFFIFIKKNPSLLEDMDIKFVLSRLSMERQHQGVQRVYTKKLLPFLFPEKISLKNVSKKRDIDKFFNPLVASNKEQKTAVLNILNGTSLPYPYIIYGPPGTGKTVTLVEAVLQLFEKTNHRILICAPSNAACDVITKQLIKYCDNKSLLRVLSSTVDISSVYENIIPFTNYMGDDQFRLIYPEELLHYRIVITTLIYAGKYTDKYHPDVLFIDEAAQAGEPEACCALGLMDKGKKIILAGDPNQLGPSLSSELCKTYGLGKSLLERLMEYDVYNNHNPKMITMLVNNFRNHSKILHIPNKFFYCEKLKPLSISSENDPVSEIFVFNKIQERFKTKKAVKKRIGHAVEFCNVSSDESREGKSPSYYNNLEVEWTLKYIQALLDLEFKDKNKKVVPTDIGVVTPYARQVCKLKAILKNRGLLGIEIGTTEIFQGREKRVLIISTVRAKKDLMINEALYKLGFVSDPKRFNVALTRAMSKLIVIGCAHVLATDERWLYYIDYCQTLGAFCGTPFVKRTDDHISDTTNRIKNIKKDTQYVHQ